MGIWNDDSLERSVVEAGTVGPFDFRWAIAPAAVNGRIVWPVTPDLANAGGAEAAKRFLWS